MVADDSRYRIHQRRLFIRINSHGGKKNEKYLAVLASPYKIGLASASAHLVGLLCLMSRPNIPFTLGLEMCQVYVQTGLRQHNCHASLCMTYIEP
jgi:hypothetical protein